MTEYFDSLETRNPELREREQLARLPALIAHAKNAPAFARIFSGTDAAAVTTREALARLPVTRKSELLLLQKADRPFGGFAATRCLRPANSPSASTRYGKRATRQAGPWHSPSAACTPIRKRMR